jgi:hypothetical protein
VRFGFLTLFVLAVLACAGCGDSSFETNLQSTRGETPADSAVLRVRLENTGAEPLDHLLIIGYQQAGVVAFGPQQFDFHRRDALEVHVPATVQRIEVEAFSQHGVTPLFDFQEDLQLQAGVETPVVVDVAAVLGSSAKGVSAQMAGASSAARLQSDAAVTISRMTTSPLPCAPNAVVTASVVAASTADSNLSYQWTSDWAIVGAADSSTVKLQAPALDAGVSVGSGRASVVVTDGAGNTATGRVVLFSRAESPLFENLTFDVPILNSTVFAAEVEDPQGSPLTYAWTIGGSRDFQGTQENLATWTWSPPGIPGLYRLVVKATNAAGLAAQDVAELRVESPGWPSEGRDLQGTRRHTQESQLAAAPSQVWATAAGSAGLGQGVAPPVVSRDGTTYVVSGTEDQVVVKLSALGVDGSTIWSKEYPRGRGASSLALHNDGTIYFVNGKLHALETDGSVRWVSQENCFLPPQIGADGTVYTGAEIGTGPRVLAFAPDGTLLRSTSPGGIPGKVVQGTMAFSQDGILHVTTQVFDGDPNVDRRAFVTAVSPDGSVRWTLGRESLQNALDASSPVVGPDGTVYVMIATPAGGFESQAKLVAIDRLGQVKWTCDLSGDSVMTNPAVASDGSVRALTGKVLDSVSPAGEVLWSEEFSESGARSPILTSDDGTYIAFELEPRVIAVDKAGERRWEASFALPIVGDPVIDTNGRILLPGQDIASGPQSSQQGFLTAVGL